MRLLVLATAAAALLPAHGVVVPGRSLGGLRIGDPAARVQALWGGAFGVCRGCGRYYVLLLPRRNAVTDFYVYNERLWGFGLRSGSVPACRT